MIAGNLALLATGVFSGAAAYVSVVEHPARMNGDPAHALMQWRPSYRRAAVMQASLAVIGTALALVAWKAVDVRAWLYGALCLGANIPYTLVIMMPVNSRLADDHLDPAGDEAKTLLDRWGKLHAFRCFLGLVAFAFMLTARL
jgi:hypothetical protein